MQYAGEKVCKIEENNVGTDNPQIFSQLNYENDYCIKYCIRFLQNCKALDEEETVGYTISFYHQ